MHDQRTRLGTDWARQPFVPAAGRDDSRPYGMTQSFYWGGIHHALVAGRLSLNTRADRLILHEWRMKARR
jgi:hypothetical protein